MPQQAFISLRHNYFLLQCHKKQLNYTKVTELKKIELRWDMIFFGD